MKRFLPIFFAAILTLVSCPILASAGESTLGSLFNNSSIENFLNRETEAEPKTSENTVPGFQLSDIISQFMDQNKTSETVSDIASEEVPASEEAAAEVPVPEEEAAPAPTDAPPVEDAAPGEASAPEEETSTEEVPEETPETFNADKAEELLACFDNQTYSDTMASLMSGAVIKYGDYSYDAAGLQQILVDLGCYITIDGNAGPGTFSALNNILTNIGMEETYVVDAALYTELMAMALINSDPDTADEILPKYYEPGENNSQYQYIKACFLYAQGRYYRAMEAFEESQYGDWEERAALCIQDWPSNGELWHNSNYYSQQMSLTFQVNSYDETEGKCFEVYTTDGILVSALFLTGSGSVTTWLPGGAYKIKNASGSEWYGVLDAFGRYGYYEFMEFDEDESDPYLTWLYSGYEWTITVNVLEPDPEMTNIESISSDWETWTN